MPGLEELPDSFPLDRRSLSRLIKANFRRHKDGVAKLSEGYTTLDQVGLAANTPVDIHSSVTAGLGCARS